MKKESKMLLRPYQLNIKHNTLSLLLSTSIAAVLIYAPTGAGKTVIISHILKDLHGKRVLALVPRQALVGQMYLAFIDAGLSVAVMHNDLNYVYRDNDPNKKIIFNKNTSNVQIIISLSETWKNNSCPGFTPDILVLDEAHKTTASGFQEIRDEYLKDNPSMQIIGLTATPFREKSDTGCSLDEWYTEDGFVNEISMRELIESNYLLTPKYYEPNIDTDNPDAVVKFWKETVEGSSNERTVIFCSNTAELVDLAGVFNQNGVPAEFITAGSDIVAVDNDKNLPSTTAKERLEIFSRLEQGVTKVLLSVNALAEGWDQPCVAWCFLYREISAKSLFAQAVGRVLRPYGTETEAHIVDFYNNLTEHGPAEELIWSLGSCSGGSIYKGKEIYESARAGYTKKFVICSKESCRRVYRIQQDKCPHCGEELPVKIKKSKAQNKKLESNIKTVRTYVHKEVTNHFRYKGNFPIDCILKIGEDILNNKVILPAAEEGITEPNIPVELFDDIKKEYWKEYPAIIIRAGKKV